MDSSRSLLIENSYTCYEPRLRSKTFFVLNVGLIWMKILWSIINLVHRLCGVVVFFLHGAFSSKIVLLCQNISLCYKLLRRGRGARFPYRVKMD